MQLYRKEQRPLKSHGFDVRFPWSGIWRLQVTSSQVTSLNHLQPEESKIQPVTYYVRA